MRGAGNRLEKLKFILQARKKLQAVFYTDFSIDIGKVSFDCLLGNKKGFCKLLVGFAVEKGKDDFLLTFGDRKILYKIL